MTPWHWNFWPWYAAGIYFIVSAARIKRAKVKEPISSRLFHTIMLVLAYCLLFWRKFPLGLLNEWFLPGYAWVAYLGLVLTCAGCAITIWARHSLGQYWSGRITLKEDHKLIQSGPYAWIRHPLYTGLLLAMFGTALVSGQWQGLLGFVIGVIGFSLKARREETLLSTEFAEQYSQYRQRAGFLLPKLR